MKEKQGGPIPTGLKRWPLKLVNHLANTSCVSPSPAGPAGCWISSHLFPIHQLGTGYCMLNEYRYKLNQYESSEYDCGEIEIVQHFLLECPLYEEECYFST